MAAILSMTSEGTGRALTFILQPPLLKTKTDRHPDIQNRRHRIARHRTHHT